MSFNTLNLWIDIELETCPEEDGHDTSMIVGLNSQAQVSDWKATTRDRLGVASRFVQTLLKKVPGCVDANPVKVAFAIAKVIIKIKDVSFFSLFLARRLTFYLSGGGRQ